jgi:imidazolonepropionase-like amidohydrolase
MTLAVVAAAGWLASLAGQEPAASAVAFEHARVIIGDARAPIEDATVVVTSSRIAQVGRSSDVTLPAGATRIDLSGKTLMPSIVDTHNHLGQTREALTLDLRRRAYFGVSAATSLGQDTSDAPFELRAQPMPGLARIFTAGRGVTGPEPGRTTAPFWVTTAAEARKAVQDNAARKVDIIKIWVDDRNGTVTKLSPELYGAAIDEAHKNSLRVIAHVFALDDAKGLVRAGVDAFAHGVRDRDVDDEFMALVKARPNLVLGPNLPDRGVAVSLDWLRTSLPPADLAALEKNNTARPEAQAAFAIQARNLARMSAAGVRIVLGTDGNTPYAPHVEMADMVAAGMSPAQVIVAATSSGAAFLGMSDAGTIAPGKSADFIVLDANPLDDIANSRRISSVYVRGAQVNRSAYP